MGPVPELTQHKPTLGQLWHSTTKQSFILPGSRKVGGGREERQGEGVMVGEERTAAESGSQIVGLLPIGDSGDYPKCAGFHGSYFLRCSTCTAQDWAPDTCHAYKNTSYRFHSLNKAQAFLFHILLQESKSFPIQHQTNTYHLKNTVSLAL